MCGICGYIGHREAAPILLEVLEIETYRGYDSAGIATHNGKTIEIRKGVGKLRTLNDELKFLEMNGKSGIAHTRWGTHGGITVENTHPHISCNESVALVHNGIFENHDEFRDGLKENGHTFKGQTDTEVIVHLVEDLYPDNPIETAVKKVTEKMEGNFALAVIGKYDPGKIVVTRKGSPVVVGFGKDGREYFVASDYYAFGNHTNEVVFLNDYETAILSNSGVEFFDKNMRQVKKNPQIVEKNLLTKDMKGYSHHMDEEIKNQSKSLTQTIEMVDLRELSSAANELLNSDFIYGVGCGTSYHSLLYLKLLMAKLLDTRMEVTLGAQAKESMIIRDNTTLISMSQSGETADVLEPVSEAKSKGAKIVSITNTKGSSLARESDKVLYLNAGPEFGVAATKTFTSQLVLDMLLTYQMGRKKGIEKVDEIRSALLEIPGRIPGLIEANEEYVKDLASYVKKRNAVYFMGRREHEITAKEGALKLKEVSYLHSEAHNAGELKHGPLALVSADEQKSNGRITGTLIFVSVPNTGSSVYNDTMNNIHEAKTRGAYLIGLIDGRDTVTPKYLNEHIKIPPTHPYLRPIYDSVIYQMLAYNTATAQGFNPDQPRNLAKSVTVK